VCVPAELADVALHPAQRGLLVHQAVVAGRPARVAGQGGMREEAERAEPVVDGDHDRAVRYQPGRVIVLAFAEPQSAAVNPDQDWPSSGRPGAG
jgi:hypothetical protein